MGLRGLLPQAIHKVCAVLYPNGKLFEVLGFGPGFVTDWQEPNTELDNFLSLLDGLHNL
jgi:hypothetical protein